MRIGKAIDHSRAAGVAHPKTTLAARSKLKVGLLAAVPAAVLLSAVWKIKKRPPAPAGAKERDGRK